MNRIIVNKDSYDKDCADLSCYFVAFEGRIIWPVTLEGRTVEEVEGN